MAGLRSSNILGIVGTNNTGKTVITEMLIKKFNEKRDRIKSDGKKYPSNFHKLAIFDVQNRMQHLMREGDINIRVNTENWEEQILNLRDSLVVFDDFKILVGNEKTGKSLRDIFGFRSEHGLDLIFIVWHPNLFPVGMSYFLDKYYLFRTNGSDKDFVKRLNGDDEELIKCKHILDKEFLKYTPLEYSKKYPNFPFIFYDTGTNKATKVNF